jgi:hypothetical protein
MEAGKNSVIYMGLISGPSKADDTCGKTTVMGTRFHCIPKTRCSLSCNGHATLNGNITVSLPGYCSHVLF